jgi:hypothetical protein
MTDAYFQHIRMINGDYTALSRDAKILPEDLEPAYKS